MRDKKEKMDDLSYLKQVLEEYDFTFQEILQLMDWGSKKKKLYRQVIDAWEEQGEIYRLRNVRYTLPGKAGLIKGEIAIST